jgi:excisionase family DNA binding protein
MNELITRLTLVQHAAVQAEAQTLVLNELLNLYLVSTYEQREKHFADTSRAAEIAGVSRRTIQLWIEIGMLPALRIGRNYKVSVDSLCEYLRSQLGT